MNAPGMVARVMGYGPVCWGLVAFAALMSAAWWSSNAGGFSWLVPVIAIAFAARARKARQHVLEYRELASRWVSNLPPEEKAQYEQGQLVRRRRARTLMIVASWLVVFVLIGAQGSPLTPEQKSIAVVVWLALSLWLLAKPIAAFVRRVRRGRGAAATSKKAGQDAAEDVHIVTVCAPSIGAPATRQITRALPDYCQSLLSE